jgi:hypothetical protein
MNSSQVTRLVEDTINVDIALPWALHYSGSDSITLESWKLSILID